MAAILSWLTTVTTALFAINTAADIGGKIHRGVKQGKVHRAQRRWQMSPQKAARKLEAHLRSIGDPGKVKPALEQSGLWHLLVRGSSSYPPEFGGYSVISRDSAPASIATVEVGRGGRGGGQGGGRGPGGFRGGRHWGGRRWGGGGGWYGGWGAAPFPIYLRRRRSELDELEAELDEEHQLDRIKRKHAALARG